MTYRSEIFLIESTLSILTIIMVGILFTKPVRSSDIWNATVTPLASIIGSGFLIVAPLLWGIAGYKSVWVLGGVVIVGYGIGSVIRYNIKYVEPLLSTKKGDRVFDVLNHASYLILGVSYFISVTFYIRILSAFALKLFMPEDPFIADILTTLILVLIGIVGYWRGFDQLEILEVCSVNLKMGIIFMFILALFLYDWLEIGYQYTSEPENINFSWDSIKKIFGMLLIIQGFEISRYIGHKYDADLRIKTMKFAQIISSVIYLSFTFLIMFLITKHQAVNETSIIDISRKISTLLPFVIVAGAIFSQFSAAIADTVGCGGVISEYSSNKISRNGAYLSIACGCIALVWVANIFEIITYASRMFAAYYLTQCFQALYGNYIYRFKGQFWSFYFVGIGIITFMIFCFGIPVT